jgi:hypothetical protein
MSASVALATGDPSSSPVPARAPPPSAEHDQVLSLHPNILTPHLPPSPTLQGHTVDVIHHRSCLAAVEHRRPKHPPLPPRCVAARVSSAPNRLPRCPPCGPRELTESTLPPASHHRPTDESATTPSRAQCTRSVPASWVASPPDRAARLRPRQPFS